MQLTQWIVAGFLGLAGSATHAVPVLMTSPFINWHSDEYINLGEPNVIIGDCRMGCTGFEYDADLSLTIDGASAHSNRHGSLDYAMSYHTGNTSYDFHTFEEVFASVDARLDGSARAAIRLDRFIVSFDVFEPTLYTGTYDIYAGEAAYSPSHVSEWIGSGSVLDEGRYSTTVVFSDFLTTGLVTEGRSVYAARHTNWDYNFSNVVPLPATLPLLGLGLLGIGWARLRRASLEG